MVADAARLAVHSAGAARMGDRESGVGAVHIYFFLVLLNVRLKL